MADEKQIALAAQVYKTLCQALDKRNWNYTKDEEKLVVVFNVNGDDIPMRILVAVDVQRQLIRLLSYLPFKMDESKRMDGAIAAGAVSYQLADGSFDYNLADGSIIYRMTASFRESTVGVGLFEYLIDCACMTVDEYNDQFLAINKGLLSISDFIAKLG